MKRNRWVRLIGLAALVGALWWGASACGSSEGYDVTGATYLDAAGVKDNTPFTLHPLGSAQDANPVYLSAGANQAAGTLPVQMVRMSIEVDDQRTGKHTVVLDYPLSKIQWDIKDDTTPSITFTRVQNSNNWLYRMSNRQESLWTRNKDNWDKNEAIDRYDHTPQDLFNAFTLKAKITLPKSVYDAQVQPLLFQPAKTG